MAGTQVLSGCLFVGVGREAGREGAFRERESENEFRANEWHPASKSVHVH